MEFCKAFNVQTAGMPSDALIPVVITANADKTFTFTLKKPPASYFLQKAAVVTKGNSTPGRGSIIEMASYEQLFEKVPEKMQDMNAYTKEEAVMMLEGTARSIGIEVKKS